MLASEAMYFDGAHFAHIVAYYDRMRDARRDQVYKTFRTRRRAAR